MLASVFPKCMTSELDSLWRELESLERRLRAPAPHAAARSPDWFDDQLKSGVKNNPAIEGKLDQFGQRHTVDIPVTGPTGSGVVRTGWIYKVGSDVPKLTTLLVK